MPKSKLSPVSWTELVKRLRKLGFDGPYQGGKHPYMIKEASPDYSKSTSERNQRRPSFTNLETGWNYRGGMACVQTSEEFLESR